MIGAGPLIVIDAEKAGRTHVEPVVEAHHVFVGVDGETAFADFSEDAVRVAVDAVKGRPVEGRAEARAALVTGEIMKTLVRIFGQTEAGEEARRFFRFLRLHSGVAVPAIFRVAVFSVRARFAKTAAFRFAQRLEIHFAIGAVGEGKLARQTFA